MSCDGFEGTTRSRTRLDVTALPQHPRLGTKPKAGDQIPQDDNSKTLLEHIPWLGGALHALVVGPPDTDGGELSDADTRLDTPESPKKMERIKVLERAIKSPGKPEAALEDHRLASRSDAHEGLESDMLMVVAHSEHKEEGLTGRLHGWLSRLDLGLRPSSSTRSHSPLAPIEEPAELNRSHLNSDHLYHTDACQNTADTPAAPKTLRTGFNMTVFWVPNAPGSHQDGSGSANQLVEEDLDSRASVLRQSSDVGDPLALSKDEEKQHQQMREDIVRNFGRHIDKLEIGEKFKQVTGDLSKNLGKAGDKLLNVWDLNDLKDDTIEMKEHYEVDIKEDLGKRVKGAQEAVDKAKNGLSGVTDHLRRTGLAIQIETPLLLQGLAEKGFSRNNSRSSSPVAVR